MLYRAFHPREGTLLHMLDLYTLLLESVLMIGVTIGLVNDFTPHPFSQADIAYFMLFGTFVYSLVAIVNSLEIMGFVEPDEDECEEDE